MMHRAPIVAGNWKMNLDHVEAVHLVQELGIRLRAVDVGGTEVLLVPPFTDLRSVSSVIESERLSVALGAQHVSEHESGAYTGEVSAAMLARLGALTVLVGHSERRRLFGMDDAVVARTAASALRGGLRPMVCVGETEQERADGLTEAVLTRQLSAALDGLEGAEPDAFLLAYEPVWAIGTGLAATVADAEDACRHLRMGASQRLGEGVERLRILYGGSASPDNAGELVAAPSVDGLLVGGASLTAAGFAAIVEAVADCYRSTVRNPRR
jgi:triosephosphate isomerase